MRTAVIQRESFPFHLGNEKRGSILDDGCHLTLAKLA